MRILLAGASGAIGRRLLPMLQSAGHETVGMSRAQRGEGWVCADALDAESTRRAVELAAPELIIHQLTSIPARIDPRRMERDFELNDRLRVEGTRNLIAAAPGVRIIAQSIAFAYAPGPAGLRVESDPLNVGPGLSHRTIRAVAELEAAVLAVDGIVLRYGYFHGPGTAYAPDGSVAQDARRRRLPIVGDGAGVWSFVHVDDAARATVGAIGASGPAVYNIVEDEPQPASVWVPAFARSIGAPEPLRVPVWLARRMAGERVVAMMTQAQGASNALAKAQLGWAAEHRAF